MTDLQKAFKSDEPGFLRFDVKYLSFPKEHWAKLNSTNPNDHLNGKINRRTEVVFIFPNDEAIARLVGAPPLE